MECPRCSQRTAVTETRRQLDGTVERRRACKGEEGCGNTFWTREALAPQQLQVRKSDGSVVEFSGDAIFHAVEQASLHKLARPDRIRLRRELVDEVVLRLYEREEVDDRGVVESVAVGEAVMYVLRSRDPLWAIRFGLVFRGRQDDRGSGGVRFQDAVGFLRWLEEDHPDEVERAGSSTGAPEHVVNRSGVREKFEPEKLIRSIRIVSKGQRPSADEIAGSVAAEVIDALRHQALVTSGQLAQLVLERLVDHPAAYLRYSSAVKHFEKVEDFVVEARGLTQRRADG